MTNDEIKDLIQWAKKVGVSELKFSDWYVKFYDSKMVFEPSRSQPEPPVHASMFVDSPPDLTDEELLFYATPYYDELQAKKKVEEGNSNG